MRVDPSGCIRFINNFGLRFFDYREKEILGRNVADTIFPDRSTSCNLRAIIENIMQHPEGYATYVMENVRSNGERVWIAWTYRPVQNERDEVVEVLCIGTM
jgi:PAS domain S-box-containing protein